MKRKCSECDFEADDNEYVFFVFPDVVLCSNCNEALGINEKGTGIRIE